MIIFAILNAFSKRASIGATAGALALGLACNASALMVDIDRGSVQNNVQAGFEGFTHDGSSAHTEVYASADATDGTIDVTVSGTTHYRDYNPITGGPFLGLNNLLRDEALRNAPGTMTLTLGDLKAGLYEITTYHHDTQFAGGLLNLELTDAVVTGEQKYNGPNSSGGTPAAITAVNFTFESNGVDDILIDIERLNQNTGGNHVTLNGFELSRVESSVPEPATATLALVGFASVMMRRRRSNS